MVGYCSLSYVSCCLGNVLSPPPPRTLPTRSPTKVQTHLLQKWGVMLLGRARFTAFKMQVCYFLCLSVSGSCFLTFSLCLRIFCSLCCSVFLFCSCIMLYFDVGELVFVSVLSVHVHVYLFTLWWSVYFSCITLSESCPGFLRFIFPTVCSSSSLLYLPHNINNPTAAYW